MIPWISADDIARLVSPGAAVEALRSTLLGGFDPADDHPRTFVDVRGGQFLLMPADAGEYAGVKVVTVSPENPSRGLPRIQGLYLLQDAVTLTPRAVLDGIALTSLRTPAVSVAAVADVLKSRFGSGGATVLVYGVGPQGIGHVDAIASQIAVNEVVVAVRSADRAEGFLADCASRGLPARFVLSGAGAEAEVARADVIVAATTAREPLFDGSLVKDACVLMAVGSHDPDARELDSRVLGRASVVVESLASALRECGDVVMAVADGSLAADDIFTMKDTVLNRGAHLAPDGPVVFKSAGMSWEDLSVACVAFEAFNEEAVRR